MIKTRAGFELLRFLSHCKPGDVLARDAVREHIKKQVPTGKRVVKEPRYGTTRGERGTSRGSSASQHLNSALRELQRRGVLERGAANSIVVLDLSAVPGLKAEAERHLSTRRSWEEE